MRIPILALLAAICSLSGLFACAQPGGAAATDDPAGSPQAIARQLAADYAGVSPADVDIISIEWVEFSDSSLGCPQPDMAYLTVITPGYKVLARANDKDVDVRVAGQQGLVCEPTTRDFPKR